MVGMCDIVIEGERICAEFSEFFDKLTGDNDEKILLMRYLPRVVEGDRRIIVVDGEIYGAYLRTSSDGHWVQNVSFGAGCELVPVEHRDREIVDATCGNYLDAGIHILGYDLLRDDTGDWRISEINAGNIGGLFRIEYLGVAGVTDRFVSWLQNFHDRKNPEHKGDPRTAGSLS
jgi:glutathione synthase/RimK-type ligase-like ATP-grasp enzyme